MCPPAWAFRITERILDTVYDTEPDDRNPAILSRRVAYWEPAKYVAKLRKAKTNDSLLLLKCDMGAGHFSQSGRFDRLKDVALELAFLIKTQVIFSLKSLGSPVLGSLIRTMLQGDRDL